ncbi:hypothetical protein E2C01_032933 [Portunus trituberculatus]|uniref:Uncharacterized protein n=1 Tax=Portunus trituberculatus TaxID=210409 RepID=A0A5B7F2K1_PORTR|nr:hypothetical protein [Portunus trituberculatus]
MVCVSASGGVKHVRPQCRWIRCSWAAGAPRVSMATVRCSGSRQWLPRQQRGFPGNRRCRDFLVPQKNAGILPGRRWWRGADDKPPLTCHVPSPYPCLSPSLAPSLQTCVPPVSHTCGAAPQTQGAGGRPLVTLSDPGAATPIAWRAGITLGLDSRVGRGRRASYTDGSKSFTLQYTPGRLNGVGPRPAVCLSPAVTRYKLQ